MVYPGCVLQDIKESLSESEVNREAFSVITQRCRTHLHSWEWCFRSSERVQSVQFASLTLGRSVGSFLKKSEVNFFAIHSKLLKTFSTSEWRDPKQFSCFFEHYFGFDFGR